MSKTIEERERVVVRFEIAPDLISGIEFTSNGHRVGWSIADYLASLEKGVGELLKEQDRQPLKVSPKPNLNFAESKPEPGNQ